MCQPQPIDTVGVTIKASILDRISNLFSSLLGGNRPAVSDIDVEKVNARWEQVRERFNQQVDIAVDNLIRAGDVPDFIRDMKAELRVLHLQAEIIGTNGNVDNRARSRMNEALKKQFQFLGKWEGQLKKMSSDQLAQSEQALKVRAHMYAEPAYRELQEAMGVALGIPILPFYPKDGDTECLVNCKCQWRFDRVSDGWDCYWVVDKAAENCPTCLRRERIANPLRIRNGTIQEPGNLAEAYKQ